MRFLYSNGSGRLYIFFTVIYTRSFLTTYSSRIHDILYFVKGSFGSRDGMGLESGIGLSWYGVEESFLISCVWFSTGMKINNLCTGMKINN